MSNMQSKQVIPFVPVSTAASATTTGNIDTLGFDYATIDVILDTASATTAVIALKLSECDTTVVSSFADVSGAVGGTDFTLPVGPAATGTWGMKFNVDLRARKRYLKLTITPGTTAIVAAVANLTKGDGPVNTTSANVKALVEL